MSLCSIHLRNQCGVDDFSLALAAQEKLQVKMPPDCYRGYMGEAESLAASYGQESPPDLKESLSIGPVEVPAGDPYFAPEQAGAFFAANQWPVRPAELRPVWTEYYDAMQQLATQMMRIFALALDLDEYWFESLVDRHITNMSAIHYSPLLRDPLPGQLRGGAHTDFGSITIVQRDAAPGGLQVLLDGEWIDVPYVEDSFVINLGDLMAEWTNDEWVPLFTGSLYPTVLKIFVRTGCLSRFSTSRITMRSLK